MASTTSPADQRPVIDMAELGARLVARQAELRAQGIDPELSRNAGGNRTESKRALLKAIEDAGGKW